MPSTRNQVWAQSAYERVIAHKDESWADDYGSFARSFPALIHTCGLAQAIAFAQAKGVERGESQDQEGGRALALGRFTADLAAVLGQHNAAQLAALSRQEPVSSYLRLSRDALGASVWLKRYVEALFAKKKTPNAGDPVESDSAGGKGESHDVGD